MPILEYQARAAAAAAGVTRMPWRTLGLFVLAFFLLQSGFEAARGTALERLVVHTLTIRPAAALVEWARPELDVQPQGASLATQRTRLNIVAGCEGVEAMLLLVAAVIAAGSSLGSTLAGIAAGLAAVYLANLLRVAGLFLAADHDRALFALLHGYVTPVAMIGVVIVVFSAWLGWAARRPGAPPPA